MGVAAFADNGTYPVTARAVEPSEAHVWDGARITALMHRFPIVAINAARMIADRFHELQRQHRELMTERVERLTAELRKANGAAAKPAKAPAAKKAAPRNAAKATKAPASKTTRKSKAADTAA